MGPGGPWVAGLQSVAGYLGLAPVFAWDSALLSIFQDFFAGVNKDFILAWGLHTGV